MYVHSRDYWAEAEYLNCFYIPQAHKSRTIERILHFVFLRNDVEF